MPSIHRRMLLLSAAALSLPSHAADAFDFQGMEKRCGGKLGVSIVDTASGRHFGWRQDERFPFCSSFKAPLAAFVLWQADQVRCGSRIPWPMVKPTCCPMRLSRASMQAGVS
ncbi:hypothetical protein ACFQOZ_19915 [Comamonas endophytica]|uniref:hypothetical protein n=1 Tax=Comamonas endophytica TaxID=2949090 RepID=UPI0036118CB5